jgi:hypothetical protein
MGISPIGKWNIGGFEKMKKKQGKNLSKNKPTRSSRGSVVFGTELKGHPSRLEAQENEAMSRWVKTELRSISCL